MINVYIETRPFGYESMLDLMELQMQSARSHERKFYIKKLYCRGSRSWFK